MGHRVSPPGSAGVSERVFAIVSMYENGMLLPHFLAHYAALGAHRIVVAVRSPERGELYEAAVAAASCYPARVVWRESTLFADSDRAAVEEELLRDEGVDQDDYVIYADLDEFPEYPAALAEIVADMNAHHDWALRGWIIDRVAEDGTLAPIAEQPSLGKQFPLACDITDGLLRGWRQKIVLCRFRVQLEGGVRHDTINAWYERVPIGTSEDYVVNHFRWTAGLERRVEARLSAWIGPSYRRECEDLLAYLRRYGRINVEDPALRTRWAGALRIFSAPS